MANHLYLIIRPYDTNQLTPGIRQVFYDPYSNYVHYGRLDADRISEWHPSFLQLAATLSGCSKRYQKFLHQS
jgi:putative transposase